MQTWPYWLRGDIAHHMVLLNELNMRRGSLLTENEARNKVNTWSDKNPSGYLNWLPSLQITFRHQIQGKMKCDPLAYFSNYYGIRMCIIYPQMEKSPPLANKAFSLHRRWWEDRVHRVRDYKLRSLLISSVRTDQHSVALRTVTLLCFILAIWKDANSEHSDPCYPFKPSRNCEVLDPPRRIWPQVSPSPT